MKNKIYDLDYSSVKFSFNEFRFKDQFSRYEKLISLESKEISRKNSVNFVINDYLALSNDIRVKYSFYKADSAEPMLHKAEEYLSWIFDKPVLLFPNSTVTHKTVIPLIVNKNDSVIIDSYIQSSLRIAGDLFKICNIEYSIVSHNCISMLEERISSAKKTGGKIWYLADSIYSSSGDVFPLKEMKRLLDNYSHFHLYIDDSKGLSWVGENGKGYVFSFLHHHPRVVLSSSLSKGFGTEGGILVCKDEMMKKRISKDIQRSKSELILRPEILRSIIESAKIHLSYDIYSKQAELQRKIILFTSFSLKLDLPIINHSGIPLAFFVLGRSEISQRICFNLQKKGYYLNVSSFPTIPANNSGIMANITLYQSDDDIKAMLRIFKDEFDKESKKRNAITDDILQKDSLQEPYS